MRINKYIAQAGICSRRKADELIIEGKVSVNGKKMTEPGYSVEEEDRVEVNGTLVGRQEKKVYLLLNKPVGYVTTVSDEKDRPTVLDLITDVEERIFPVGRLDYNTSGMLLLTNDGDFAYRVSHPRHEMTKTYRARVAGVLSAEKCAKLRRGVDIGGFVTSSAKVEIVKGLQRSTVVDLSIHEGKNHQVRRMFKAVGNNVQELKRIAIGKVYLGRLREGDYRKLTREEIEYFKNC